MADDIKNSAFMAVIFAMFCMALYILVRFRDVAFSIAECTKRGIRVVAGTQFGILHRPEAWEQTEREMRANASVLKAIGAHHLVYLPSMLRDLQTGGWAEDPNLSDAD